MSQSELLPDRRDPVWRVLRDPARWPGSGAVFDVQHLHVPRGLVLLVLEDDEAVLEEACVSVAIASLRSGLRRIVDGRTLARLRDGFGQQEWDSRVDEAERVPAELVRTCAASPDDLQGVLSSGDLREAFRSHGARVFVRTARSFGAPWALLLAARLGVRVEADVISGSDPDDASRAEASALVARFAPGPGPDSSVDPLQ